MARVDQTPLLPGDVRGGFTLPLTIAMVGGCMGALQYGYNTAALNAPEANIKKALGLSTVGWSLSVAIFAIGGMLGCALAGMPADRLGRRYFLAINAIPFIIGGLLQTFAANLTMMVIGRFAVGFGSGGATVVVPMYLGEVAPPNLRGAFGTLNQFAIVGGILIAEVRP